MTGSYGEKDAAGAPYQASGGGMSSAGDPGYGFYSIAGRTPVIGDVYSLFVGWPTDNAPRKKV